MTGSYVVKGFDDFANVVSVDDDGVEAKALHPDAIGFHVVLQWSGIRLAQPVDVDNGAQVVQLKKENPVVSSYVLSTQYYYYHHYVC